MAFAGAEAATPAVGLREFARGVERCTAGGREERLRMLFVVLAGADDDPTGAANADAADPALVSQLLLRAYALDAAVAPSQVGHIEPFACAAKSAAIAAAAYDEDPSPQQFAAWASSQLPGLATILASHVESLCDSTVGVDAAMRAHEQAQRQRGVTLRRELRVEDLLLMPTDEARRQLRGAMASGDGGSGGGSGGGGSGGGSGGSGSGGGSGGGGSGGGKRAERNEGDGDSRAGGASVAADGGGTSDPSDAPASPPRLVHTEWLWLISHALELRLETQSAWRVLFSSYTDGRSLHTLAEKTSGYARGVRARTPPLPRPKPASRVRTPPPPHPKPAPRAPSPALYKRPLSRTV